MSRAYRISVSESLNRVVQAEDGVCSKLELLPILSQEELGGLLTEELARRGFTQQGPVALRTEPDGVRVAIDVQTGDVSVTLAEQQAVELKAQGEEILTAEQGEAHAREKARAQARARLEERATDAQERLREDLTRRLEARLRDLKQELDGVTNRVTAEALKVRARQLGTVEEISEDPATGSLTIKVRV
jgi:negative regulator of genetic competence, sporulation and motility